MATPFAEEVFRLRREHADVIPSRQRVYEFVDNLGALLFPHLSGESEFFSAGEIDGSLAVLARDLKALLHSISPKMPRRIEEAADAFFSHLPEIFRKVWLDAEAIHVGDPAATSIDEVVSAYPGFFAIYVQRVAHLLFGLGIPVLPRILTEYAHVRTGIDIHPGARIGERFCIDHGTGVVIGETALIGDNVKIYQGVSLGALSVSKHLAGTKRHPTVEDNVVIYSNAVVLGGKTVVGHDSVIGGNVWLTRSVPPFSIVENQSEYRLRNKRANGEPIDFII